MVEWITENYRWLFGGLGVALIGLVFKLIFCNSPQSKEVNQHQQSGSHSRNIQVGGDLNFNDKDQDDA